MHVQTADFIVRLYPTFKHKCRHVELFATGWTQSWQNHNWWHALVNGCFESCQMKNSDVSRLKCNPFFPFSSYVVLFLMRGPSHNKTRCSRFAVDMLSGRDTSSIILLDKLWNMQSNELAMTCAHYNVSHVMELKIWHTVSHEAKPTDLTLCSWTKWTIFCRHGLNMHFLDGKLLSIWRNCLLHCITLRQCMALNCASYYIPATKGPFANRVWIN